jgi:tRNA (uracil-5-)-methyltransferase TRM9
MKSMPSTQEVFDRIAAGWYGYRHHTIFRQELEDLAKRWQGGVLLNIGCGHGADFLPLIKYFELHGIDFSLEMIRLGQKYAKKYNFHPQLAQADMRCLPYRDNTFDNAIAVASFHHIEGKLNRTLVLAELKRILKPGGEAFITVWNHWQPRFWLKHRDTIVPWRKDNEILNRYYHLFSYDELRKLVRRSGLEIIRSFPENSYRFPLKYFSRNICLLVRK